MDLIPRESTDQSGLSLPVLVRELKGVDWFELGTQLNVPQTELRIIYRQYYYDIIQCLTEMLNSWLRANPNASWAEIAVALKRSSQGDLATTLASKYCSSVNTEGKGKRRLEHVIGTYLIISLWHKSVMSINACSIGSSKYYMYMSCVTLECDIGYRIMF